ncbi:metal-dependent hydrolase [Embleya sp. NBC_00888]|uniref:metal-dependent hydrolase n=1 Tax=Embleya sp. NBC_00888 TaxID=2975960 RepID=UPI00386CCB23|nr:metal-dependent hydrolase [Embleya sp. NBC_00888]
MALPTTSTEVTFPAGAGTGTAPILAAPVLPDGRTALVVARTPFHPLDHTWPDQPADTGVIRVAGAELAVADCVTGAVGPDGEFAVGEAIPVRRGDEDWSWLVLHVLAQALGDPGDLVGASAELIVDAERRAALSAAHTSCHLLAFALNAVLAPRWRKEVRTDSLGRPDFDNLAITSSRMDVGGSRDDYRIGKSLRKKGFTADGLAQDLPGVRDEVEALLEQWLKTDAEVRIEVPGPALTARRVWHCGLPDGDAHIPCGGSHLGRLGELRALAIELTMDEDGALVALTRPERA